MNKDEKIKNFKEKFIEKWSSGTIAESNKSELSELLKGQKERSRKIKSLDLLREDAEKFVESNSKDFKAEYDFYTVYQNSNDDKIETYILIHAFYNEKDILFNESEIERVILEDIAVLNKRLKETELPIDYCFVMPYYDYIAGGSVLFNNLISISIKNAGF